MKYSEEIYNNCKSLFVKEGLSCSEISALYNGSPSEVTLRKWSSEKKGGLTWREEQNENLALRMESVSPKALAGKLIDKIYALASGGEESLNVRSADAIAKLHKALMTVNDKRVQLPVMFQLLADLLWFIKTERPGVFSKELVQAVRDFKNSRMEEFRK